MIAATVTALFAAALALGAPRPEPPAPAASPEAPAAAVAPTDGASEPPADPAPSSAAWPGPDAAAVAIPAWLEARLAALRPADPEGYYLLGEEVADAAATEPDLVPLARTLFVLAFELDRQRVGARGLAASACIALASLERREADRRWLRALAGAIDRRYVATDWTVAAGRAAPVETALDAATVLGLARAGDGLNARRLLDKPGVAALLREYERLISNTDATGAMFRLQRAIDAWPCPECANERIVRGPGDSGPETRLCPTCRGNPGPPLSEEELIAQVRFEAMLLNGVQRSWAAQVIADQGAPLRDPDPEELAPTLGVDPTLTLWRDGRWVAPAHARRR